MKISTLLETMTTPVSDPAGLQSQQAPKFGRDPKVLEDDKLEETTTAGAIATGEPTNIGVQRRGKGSMFQGIKTSKKFANSAAVTEMDKSQTPPGRDGGEHGGKEHTAKPVTSKEVQDQSLEKLKKILSKPENMAVLKRLKTKEGVAEGSLNEGQYEMMMRNGQVKKFIAKDDADAKRIAAGHGAKSVIRLRGGVPAGKVAEGEKKPHPKTWHDVDPKLGKQVDKMSQAEKVKKGLAHPDTLKKKGVAEEKQRLDPKCWTGYKKQGTKMKGGVRVNNCVPVKEAEKYPEPEQEVIDATRRARLHREREPQGSEKIDAMLAQRNAQLQQYTETGKFWLKKKDTQEHISDAYVGKAQANQAALQLLKQHPELKGNIVITAWGPGETPVNEAELSEEQLLARDLKKQLELFKQAVDHDLGTKPNDKELGKKPKDKEVQKKK